MRAGEDLPVLATPCQIPGVLGQPSPHPPAMAEWGKPSWHQELPPLRETWYGRASAGKGVINKLWQRPTGHQLGLGVCLLQSRVGVGLCMCHSVSVAFTHFQDILASGKLFFPRQPVLEIISVTRAQIPSSLLPSVVPWEQPHSPASPWQVMTPAYVRARPGTAAP